MSHPVGLALIGCGRIAISHLDAIRDRPEHARLLAVVDTDLARAQDIARRYNVPHAFDDMARVFDLDAVEALYIATPNAAHEAQALAALAAGRHVLVEKPIAEHAAGAKRLAAAAERSGLVLAAGNTFRHGAAVRYLRDHAQDFGPLRAVQISACVHWDGPQAPWWATRTPDEGLILSLLAPHALDFLMLAMGDDDPLRVAVETARHQTSWLAEDEAMILLRYPADRMASIHLSYNQTFILDRKTLHFERAMVRIEDGEYLWVDDRLMVSADLPPDAVAHRMGGRDLSAYFRTQLEEFTHAVRGQPHRSVLHHDAYRLTALIERILAVAAASRSGTPPAP